MDFIPARATKTIRVLIPQTTLGSILNCYRIFGARFQPRRGQLDWNPSSLIPTAVAHKVDVLAISSALNGIASHALEVVRELRAVSPGTKAVVLLDSQENEDVVNAFRAGVRGIFSRESSVEMFCKCMHRVHEENLGRPPRDLDCNRRFSLHARTAGGGEGWLKLIVETRARRSRMPGSGIHQSRNCRSHGT